MSVLNQASDGLYTVLIVLVRAIVRFGPRNRDDLILACGGAVDAVDTSQLRNTLNRWTELGLFGQEDGSVTIAEQYRSNLGNTSDEAEAQLPRIVRTVAMLAENNERFWEREKSKSADLSRAVAWMLAQDVYTLDENVKKLAEARRSPDRRLGQANHRQERHALERSQGVDALSGFRSGEHAMGCRSH